LSYHLFVHVPTCTPACKSYVPHRKLLHKSAKLVGVVSSKQTINRASSTICKQEALWRSFAKLVRREDQVLRFSVDSTPIAFRATYDMGHVSNHKPTCRAEVKMHTSMTGVLSASCTMACILRRISRSVNRGLFSSSNASNQSVRDPNKKPYSDKR
jgi:hypothetical protein